MVFRRFSFLLFVRVLVLATLLMALGFSLTNTGYYAVSLLLTLVSLFTLFELHQFVSKTNGELVKFLDALRYRDFSQHFHLSHTGGNFDKLTETLNDILHNFMASNQQQEERLRHFKAMTEHIPVPMLSLYPEGKINLHNNAARALFSGVSVNKVTDLNAFGIDFAQAIESLEPGTRRLVNFSFDEMERQLTIVATQIVTGTRCEKLVSLQDIQSELDDVQLQAWQELVRVLTHEIMNSITPVASLATTATQLMADARSKLANTTHIKDAIEELEDAQHAVDTVAHRSESLMQFVKNYRSLTQLPAPNKQALLVSEIFDEMRELFSRQWQAKGIALISKVEPQGLKLSADPWMLEQALVNLLQNAEQAMELGEKPGVSLTARLNKRGHVVIEVSDNGPGIPDELLNKIFIPFFTTKHQGSGVGLALIRQMMIAHGGSVLVGESDCGGARFTLVF